MLASTALHIVSNRQSILFVFSSLASFRMQRYVIQSALSRGYAVVPLYLGGRDSCFHESSEILRNLEVTCLCFEELIDAVSSQQIHKQDRPNWMRPFRWSTLLAALLIPFLRSPNFVNIHRNILWKKSLALKQIVRENKIVAIVCSEDGISGELVVGAVARTLKLPVIDIPFGNGRRLDIENALDQKRIAGDLVYPSGFELISLRLIAPKWLKKGVFEGAVIFPPKLIIVMESMGITLRTPWTIHGGNSDILCAEDKSSLDEYIDEGIPPQRLRLTGTPYKDIMFHAAQSDTLVGAAFCKPKKIDKSQTRILLSWPASYHETYPGSNQFSSYEQMAKAVFSFLLGLTNVRLEVSIHPGCPEETAAMLKGLGVEVSDDYLIEMIPRNDIFISYFSSATRWALSIGKIVLNYDAYKIDLPNYQDQPGFLTFQSFEDFCEAITEMMEKTDVYRDLAAQQLAYLDSEALPDGGDTARIFEQIERVILKNSNRSPSSEQSRPLVNDAHD